jgi:4-hydroxybenzoate polyprenyltransferase
MKAATQNIVRVGLAAWIQALRPHQWCKNFLVFLPLVAAHRFNDAIAWKAAGICFALLCLQASAVYLMNDLFDLESDREHSKKSGRPLASGRISPAAAAGVGVAFTFFAIGAGRLIEPTISLMFALYVLLNIGYSKWLKRLAIWDLVLLTLFYSIRIAIGGLATGIELSFWLLTFSTFFFSGLAIAKRVSELQQETAPRTLGGRGYLPSDLNALFALGSVNSLLSVLILVSYFRSPEAQSLYSNPGLLWAIAPLLWLWTCRFWLATWRGQVDQDPVFYVLKDALSWIVVIVFMLIVWFAR